MELRFEKSTEDPKSHRRAVYIDDEYRGMISQPFDELIQVIFDYHKDTRSLISEQLSESEIKDYSIKDLQNLGDHNYEKATMLALHVISEDLYKGLLDFIFAKGVMAKIKMRNRMTEFLPYLEVFGQSKQPKNLTENNIALAERLQTAFSDVSDALIKCRDEYMQPRDLPFKKRVMNNTTEQANTFKNISLAFESAINNFQTGTHHENLLDTQTPKKIFALHKHCNVLKAEENKLEAIKSEVSRERDLKQPSATLIEISQQLLDHSKQVYLAPETLTQLNQEFDNLVSYLNSKRHTKKHKIEKVTKFQASLTHALDLRLGEVSKKTSEVNNELSRAKKNIFRNLWLKLSLLFKSRDVVNPDDFKLQADISYASYQPKKQIAKENSTFSRSAFSQPFSKHRKEKKAKSSSKKPPKAPSSSL